jgi:CheY-like chemotaxis protein
VRLVMLTGLDQSSHDKEALQANFSAYLVKPVTQSRLYDCLATVMADSSEAQPETTHAVKKHMANGKPRGRILVAEDNIANQKVVVHTLEGLGYRADVASNGRETVEMWSALPYQLILMDCAMPEMDGYEATAEIRRREEEGEDSRRIPIIALTANAMMGTRERCLEAGMDDYIAKPFKREELEAILERWEGARPSGAGSNGDSSESTHVQKTSPVSLNGDTLADLQETMGDDFGQFIDLFLQKSLEQIASIRTAVTQEDAQTLTEIARNLKSASKFIGAAKMSKICEQLQGFGSLGETLGVTVLTEKLENEFPRVQTWLEEERGKTSSHS